jgi:hypothetical protein
LLQGGRTSLIDEEELQPKLALAARMTAVEDHLVALVQDHSSSGQSI